MRFNPLPLPKLLDFPARDREGLKRYLHESFVRIQQVLDINQKTVPALVRNNFANGNNTGHGTVNPRIEQVQLNIPEEWESYRLDVFGAAVGVNQSGGTSTFSYQVESPSGATQFTLGQSGITMPTATRNVLPIAATFAETLTGIQVVSLTLNWSTGPAAGLSSDNIALMCYAFRTS